MLTRVDVSTGQGDLFTLQLDDEESGYLVLDIGGLDPVKATLSSSSFAGVDGEAFQSASLPTRNITFKLGLDPNPLEDSVRSLRNRLYDIFMPKSFVTLKFYMDDGLTVQVPGVVEDCSSPLFAQEPEANISIICYEPDFIDPVTVNVTGNTTSSTSNILIPYSGSSDTGVVFKLNVDRTLSDFSIYHTTPSGDLRQLDFSAPLVSGDVVTISSITGDKGATLTHLGAQSSILRAVSPQSKWLRLNRGVNKFRVYAVGAGVPWTLDYITRYGGL